jgi:Fe-S oxidoreductase
MLSNPISRWVIDKTLGIPQGRKLPSLSKISFLGRTQWSKRYAAPPSATEHKVALFVDTFGNHFNTKLADLAVKILEHNGITVHIPLRQRASGIMAYAVGHADRAARLARHNTLLFGDLIRQGYDVVTLEPASAACITKDYRCLIDEPDSELVSTKVVDFCDYLFRLHGEQRLRLDFQPIRKTVGFHAPCRSIANGSGRIDDSTAAQELLGLIPELNVRRIEEGCCGMAGSFGLKKENYRLSLQIGRGLFRKLRDDDIDFGATECSSCRMQMEHAVAKPTFHPIYLLATAYGLEFGSGCGVRDSGRK